jgi:5-enolpyruvylshikimate-3-phosphate synthase
MTKLRITDKEAAIIRAIIGFGSKGKTTFKLEELCAVIYQTGGRDRPKHWRTSTTATLRNFGYKVESVGLRLRRVSSLGAFQKGEYEFAGDFAKLLSAESLAA